MFPFIPVVHLNRFRCTKDPKEHVEEVDADVGADSNMKSLSAADNRHISPARLRN